MIAPDEYYDVDAKRVVKIPNTTAFPNGSRVRTSAIIERRSVKPGNEEKPFQTRQWVRRELDAAIVGTVVAGFSLRAGDPLCLTTKGAQGTLFSDSHVLVIALGPMEWVVLDVEQGEATSRYDALPQDCTLELSAAA